MADTARGMTHLQERKLNDRLYDVFRVCIRQDPKFPEATTASLCQATTYYTYLKTAAQ